MDLNLAWYLLVGVLIAGYAVLDGFDLGAGALSLFARDAGERRQFLATIGPVWDGNEVWLLTAGGALFAAFPIVYATVFSAFYIPLMLLLAALIFRAVALEFHGKVESEVWRRLWEWAFGIGSLLPAVLLGVAFANVMRGIPMLPLGMYGGTFLGLLSPYALIVGVLSLAMFLMHGAIYVAMKTQDALHDRMVRAALRAWAAFAVLYIVATAAAMLDASFLFGGIVKRPAFYIVLLALTISIPLIPAMLRAGRMRSAFAASALAIAAVIGMAGVSMYPCLVIARRHIEYSLTIYNAASSPRTLGAMLVIALAGMPVVIAYTAWTYWVFRGKVSVEREGY